MKRFLTGLILASVVIAFFACDDDNSLEELRMEELEKLDVFIAENYPDSVPRVSGLYYIESVKGEGELLKAGDRVQIFYATWTLDSTLVDESSGYTSGHRFEPLEFTVGGGEVIQGLEQAAIYMQLGTTANLVISSELAYGQNGDGTGFIPGFTSLLMEVEVYKVYPYPVAEE